MLLLGGQVGGGRVRVEARLCRLLFEGTPTGRDKDNEGTARREPGVRLLQASSDARARVDVSTWKTLERESFRRVLTLWSGPEHREAEPFSETSPLATVAKVRHSSAFRGA